MISSKRKNAVRKSFAATCLIAAFVILPAFSSYADEVNAEVPAGPGSESESIGQEKAATGPGSEPSDASGAPADNGAGEVMTTPVYPIVKEVDKYSYDQMEQDIRAFEALYKERVNVEVLGITLDGRNIYDVIVGNVDSDKHIVIQGGIHAREYITSLLIMKQAGETLQNYDTATYMGRSYSEMLSQTAIHFIPMVNPDGITISQFGEAGIRSEGLRQGIQSIYQADVAEGVTRLDYASYLTRWKSNAGGVDLNRNYDAAWHLVGPENRPSGAGYKGPNPFSEPESLALAYLLQREQVKVCLNYHSMGQVIYWDVAGNKQRDASLNLARQYSGDSGYRLSGELGLGGVKDWVQIKEPSMPSITVEVGSSAAPVPLAQFPAIWQQNHLGPARMMGFVLNY